MFCRPDDATCPFCTWHSRVSWTVIRRNTTILCPYCKGNLKDEKTNEKEIMATEEVAK